MHYMNGIEAKDGDYILFPIEGWNSEPKLIIKTWKVGMIHSLNPGSDSCNATVAYVVPGAVYQSSVTVGKCILAEDAGSVFVGFIEKENEIGLPKVREPVTD